MPAPPWKPHPILFGLDALDQGGLGAGPEMSAACSRGHASLETTVWQLHCYEMTIQWLAISEAAKILGLSAATLRRRTRNSHWQEGCHWRWTVMSGRRRRQFHIPNCIELINTHGW